MGAMKMSNNLSNTKNIGKKEIKADIERIKKEKTMLVEFMKKHNLDIYLDDN